MNFWCSARSRTMTLLTSCHSLAVPLKWSHKCCIHLQCVVVQPSPQKARKMVIKCEFVWNTTNKTHLLKHLHIWSWKTFGLKKLLNLSLIVHKYLGSFLKFQALNSSFYGFTHWFLAITFLLLILVNSVRNESCREKIVPTSANGSITQNATTNSAHIDALFGHFKQSATKLSQICQSKSYIALPWFTN